jgi:hypothetical protein
LKKIKISRNQILALLGGALVFVVALIIVYQVVWGGVKQPIAFNHKIHAENDLECLDCHPYFQEHASSGEPSIETCSSCHEEALGESKKEKKIVEYVNSGKEVEWQRLYRVPEDVFFSHRRHVVLGNIECKICHGDIGESSKPPSKPIRITMKNCMQCHEEKDVTNDCISCHR